MFGGVTVRFYGVRGSTPCDAPELARYGGNTSCVVVEHEGEPPFVLDLGTGLRGFGAELEAMGRGEGFRGTALLTHLHWDHVQGLPFFAPLLRPGAHLEVIGPRQDAGPLGAVFEGMMQPPYFPVRPHELDGEVRFVDAGDDSLTRGSATVTSRFVPHVGATLGYRLDWHGVSIAYVSDHGPACGATPGSEGVAAGVLELCDGVDLLIHDAQQTPAEFARRGHWGHCTVEYAVRVAAESGAASLAMFHHDPLRSDAQVDLLLAEARDLAAARSSGPDVLAAFEGLALRLAPAAARTTT